MPQEDHAMDSRDRKALSIAASGLIALHAISTGRFHPLHLVGLAISIAGGFGDGPSGAGRPVRRR